MNEDYLRVNCDIASSSIFWVQPWHALFPCMIVVKSAPLHNDHPLSLSLSLSYIKTNVSSFREEMIQGSSEKCAPQPIVYNNHPLSLSPSVSPTLRLMFLSFFREEMIQRSSEKWKMCTSTYFLSFFIIFFLSNWKINRDI